MSTILISAKSHHKASVHKKFTKFIKCNVDLIKSQGVLSQVQVQSVVLSKVDPAEDERSQSQSEQHNEHC